jgi:hypothetical protein
MSPTTWILAYMLLGVVAVFVLALVTGDIACLGPDDLLPALLIGLPFALWVACAFLAHYCAERARKARRERR